MTQEEKIIYRYRNGEKLVLSPSNARTKVTFYLGLIGGVTFASIGFILYSMGLNWTSLGIVMTIGISVAIGCWTVMRNYSIVSVKAGNIIVSDLSHTKNTVASLRSIRSVRTSRIGNIQHTALNYHLDGRHRKAVILKWVKDSESDPDSILRTLIKVK